MSYINFHNVKMTIMKFNIKTLVLFFASIQIFYGQSMNWTTQSSPTSQNLYGVAYSGANL
jgi:hypothetical protein